MVTTIQVSETTKEHLVTIKNKMIGKSKTNLAELVLIQKEDKSFDFMFVANNYCSGHLISKYGISLDEVYQWWDEFEASWTVDQGA